MKMLPVQLSLNPPLGLWSDVLWRCPPAPPSQLAELKTQLPPSLPSDPRLWSREDVNVFLRFCEREFDLPKVDHDLFQMNGKALCLLTRADFGHRCPGAGDVLHNVLQMLIIESHMMQWHLPNSPVTPTSRYPLSPHSHPPTPTWPPIAPPENAFHNAHMHHFMAPNSVTLSPPPSVDSQASSPPQGQEQQSASSTSSSGSNASNLAACSSGSSSVNSTPTMTLSGGNGAFISQHTTAASISSNQSDSDEESSYSEPSNKMLLKSNAAMAVAMAQYNNASTSNANANATSAGSGHNNNNNSSSNSNNNNNNINNNNNNNNNNSNSNNSSSSSPPSTPVMKDMPKSLSQQIASSFISSWQQSSPQSQTQSHGHKGSASTNIGTNGGGGGSASAPTTPSFMQSVKREFFPENNEPNTNGRLLWDFLQQLLNDRNQKYSDLIAWKCRDTGVFKIVDPAGLAKLWGIQKNHLSMNYDKMSRALRYYYRVNILRKVQGERHCYQFLRNPSELKNIKNISLLRQSVNGVAGGSPSNGGSSSGSSGGAIVAGGQVSGAQSACANSGSPNSWTMPHQSMQNTPSGSSVSSGHQMPQRPSSRSSNHMSLPSIASSAAAAAAVAAATAAAYGPPPTSPLFMHAINGAFHYLSNNAGPGHSPNSPALPSTPSEKFQFTALKMEHTGQECGEDMKPTDLSVAGSAFSSASNTMGTTEKRPYSSTSPTEECYPLIRNADGLTTIKLIRYNDDAIKSSTASVTVTAASESTSSVSSPSALSNGAGDHQAPDSPKQHRLTPHQDVNVEEHSNSAGGPMESSDSSNTEANGQQFMPTDLRK